MKNQVASAHDVVCYHVITRLIPPAGHILAHVWFSHPYAGVRPVCTGRSAIGLLSPDFPDTHTHAHRLLCADLLMMFLVFHNCTGGN